MLTQTLEALLRAWDAHEQGAGPALHDFLEEEGWPWEWEIYPKENHKASNRLNLKGHKDFYESLASFSEGGFNEKYCFGFWTLGVIRGKWRSLNDKDLRAENETEAKNCAEA